MLGMLSAACRASSRPSRGARRRWASARGTRSAGGGAGLRNRMVYYDMLDYSIVWLSGTRSTGA